MPKIKEKRKKSQLSLTLAGIPVVWPSKTTRTSRKFLKKPNSNFFTNFQFQQKTQICSYQVHIYCKYTKNRNLINNRNSVQNPNDKGDINCKIKLYKNGFQVNDEPFRSYDEQKNKDFIKQLKEG